MYKRVLFVIGLGILLVGMTGIIAGGYPMLPSAKNPAVDPTHGEWDDSYNYSVYVLFDKAIDVELWVWDPWFSDWSSQGTAHYSNRTNWKPIYWNDTKPFSEECAGTISKFKFTWDETNLLERRNGRLVTLMGPGPRILGNNISGDVHKNNTIKLTGSANSTTAERGNLDIEYYVHTGYVTPFNFTVQSNSSVDLELLIRDPVTESLERKGGIQHCDSREEITWIYIKPFDSIKEDEIKNYIGKKFDFTFMYGGNLYKGYFEGPELVVAFKDPKCPSVLIYNESFDYSVEVIANKVLNVTLYYNNGSAWKQAAGESQSYNDIKEWERLTWNCKATDSWEKVKFEWGGEP